jgi:hypothetical protein
MFRIGAKKILVAHKNAEKRYQSGKIFLAVSENRVFSVESYI